MHADITLKHTHSNMKERIEEDLMIPLRCSIREDPKSRQPRRWKRERNPHAFNVNSNHFPLPSVMLESGNSQKSKRNSRRCWSMACGLRLLILVFPMVYYKEIKGFLQLGHPMSITRTDVMDPPKIQRDYSSIESIYDLSTETIKPWCIVSQTNNCLKIDDRLYGSVVKLIWLFFHEFTEKCMGLSMQRSFSRYSW